MGGKFKNTIAWAILVVCGIAFLYRVIDVPAANRLGPTTGSPASDMLLDLLVLVLVAFAAGLYLLSSKRGS